MTRSIGDMCLSECGVFNLPQIVSYQLNDDLVPRKRILVIGSDGLYQNLEN